LDVTQADQKQFRKGFIEPLELAAALGLIVRQLSQRRPALFPAMLEVSKQLLLGIRVFGKDAGRIQFIQIERMGRMERIDSAGEVQVQKEERVKDDVPILGLLRAIGPKRLRASSDGIFEHIDRGAELPPEGRSPIHVHSQPILAYSPLAWLNPGADSDDLRRECAATCE
jgi:hypothetical protein